MEMKIARNVTEIEEEIMLHGNVEWRSKKNLDEMVRTHTFEKDFCIVGYATAKTMQKWGLKLYRETFTTPRTTMFTWLFAREKRIESITSSD